MALCTARARELLGGLPERIEVLLSANILKNAMGVGIPGTGMIGLPIAVALGAQIGRSEYGLEVLRDVTPEAVARARDYLAADAVSVALKEGISETLYVEVHCTAGGRRAEAVIAGSHTRFVYLACDGEVVLDRRTGASSREEEPCVPLTLRRVFDYALTAPIDELAFIDEARRLNMAAAELALGGEYGHSLGRTLRGRRELHVMGDSLFSRMLAYTSAACDARMAGAMVPVMSNSGSGNQGIAATVPVAVYARQTGASEERTRRALVLSHLTAIYIKQSLGRLSALRRGGYGVELRHRLPDGRRLPRSGLCRAEHDRQSDGDDLRRCEAQLCAQSVERRLYGRDVGAAGRRGEVRHLGRGDYRRRRGSQHPQPHGDRPRGDGGYRPVGTRHHDS